MLNAASFVLVGGDRTFKRVPQGSRVANTPNKEGAEGSGSLCSERVFQSSNHLQFLLPVLEALASPLEF